MAAPSLTYQQWLNTNNLPDSPGNKARYNLVSSKPTQTSSPSSSYGSSTPAPAPGFNLANPFTQRAGVTVAPGDTPPAAAQTGGLNLFARAPLADPQDVFPSDSSAPRIQDYPSYAEYLVARNNYLKARTSGFPAQPVAPIAPIVKPAPVTASPAAIPIATKTIAPINAPGPDPILQTQSPDTTPQGPEAGNPIDWSGIAKTTGKMLGGLGDAFSARAAAIQGQQFTPTKTLQANQQAFEGQQNAAQRGQIAAMQTQSLDTQRQIAELQSKTALTEADKNNLAALQRQKMAIDGQIQAALIGQHILPGASGQDVLGIR